MDKEIKALEAKVLFDPKLDHASRWGWSNLYLGQSLNAIPTLHYLQL